MPEDSNSDNSLPSGWTVEVRMRKNGKRDKYYFSPSSGLKFNSRVEVSRHLDNVQNKITIQRVANNVVVEKGIAEGLPSGWMKKTRITTKGDTIRRDSYYIDPVSGYAFRSMKDVERYLESGEIGRNAFKPKHKDSSDMEFEDHTLSSAGVTTNPTLSVNMGQSSIAIDQQIPKLACAGESMPMSISEQISSQCVVATELTSTVLVQAEGSDQKEGKVGLAESALVPSSTTEEAEVNQLKENSETKHGTENAENCQRKNKRKKEIDLPRRASKRLAGIKVDPVPELKTRTRARRFAVKQPGEGEAITNEDKFPNNSPHGAAKQVNALEHGSETKCISKKPVEEHRSDKDQECFSFLPLENHANDAIVKEHVRVPENEDKVDAKLDYSLDIPLGEILTDPCIAFAIETLTGVTFETSKNCQSEHSDATASVEGHSKKIKGANMGYDRELCNVFLPPENFPIPEQEAANKANENRGSYSEKPLDISWMDPCIEFAIKTLTGTIPLDSDQNHKNCLQQQLSSANDTQNQCEVAFSSVSNLCQTDYHCSQYFGTQKPMFKQESFVDPPLQHTRNVSIGNSAGARMPHCGEDGRNICRR